MSGIDIGGRLSLDEIKQLSEELKDNTSLTYLNLYFNGIGDRFIFKENNGLKGVLYEFYVN